MLFLIKGILVKAGRYACNIPNIDNSKNIRELDRISLKVKGLALLFLRYANYKLN